MGMLTKFNAGEAVEVQNPKTKEWISGTVSRPLAIGIYQVQTVVGFLTVREHDIRKPDGV